MAPSGEQKASGELRFKRDARMPTEKRDSILLIPNVQEEGTYVTG